LKKRQNTQAHLSSSGKKACISELKKLAPPFKANVPTKEPDPVPQPSYFACFWVFQQVQ